MKRNHQSCLHLIALAALLGSSACIGPDADTDAVGESQGQANPMDADAVGSDAVGESQAEPMNAAEAQKADIALVAETRGWSYDDTERFVLAQDKFSELATTIAEDMPRHYSSAVNLADPNDVPEIYFKGEVPIEAVSLVKASGLEVDLIPNTQKNNLEWNEQKDRIVQWLQEKQYDSFLVAFDDVGTIEVVVGNNAPVPRLPKALRGDVEITVVPDQVNTTENVHGGTLATGPGGSATFGWCVENSGGTRGLVTAAHVSTKTTYTHPVSGATFSTFFQAEYFGTHGEFEWYTTSGPEWPNWFADQFNNLRRRDTLKTTWFRNDNTCVFGRFSNNRSCDQIYRTNTTATIQGNTVDRQVLTDNDNTIPGDSGGGWSWSTRADGVHSGDTFLNGAWRNRFSRAARVDNALGVDICESP